MKTTRALLFFIAAVAAIVSIARGQTVQFIDLSYQQQMVQTGASTLAPDSTPFQFQVQVEGNNLTQTNPLTAATVQLPSSGPIYNLSPISHDGGTTYTWRYQSGSYGSLGAMTSAYPTASGNYTMNLTGTPSGTTTIAVPDFSASLVQAPMLGLSGGSWVGSTYYMNAAGTLTINFNNVYSGSPGPTVAYNYFLDVNGPTNGSISTPNGFINYDSLGATSAPSSISTFQITANQLQANQNYTIVVGYDDVLSVNPAAYGGSVTAVATYEIRTTINLSTFAVPEPSTYAAIFGVAALAGVMLHRRRRSA